MEFPLIVNSRAKAQQVRGSPEYNRKFVLEFVHASKQEPGSGLRLTNIFARRVEESGCS